MATAKGTIPKGWIRTESRSRPGKFFYAHIATGKSVWRLSDVYIYEDSLLGKPSEKLPKKSSKLSKCSEQQVDLPTTKHAKPSGDATAVTTRSKNHAPVISRKTANHAVTQQPMSATSRTDSIDTACVTNNVPQLRPRKSKNGQATVSKRETEFEKVVEKSSLKSEVIRLDVPDGSKHVVNGQERLKALPFKSVGPSMSIKKKQLVNHRYQPFTKTTNKSSSTSHDDVAAGNAVSPGQPSTVNKTDSTAAVPISRTIKELKSTRRSLETNKRPAPSSSDIGPNTSTFTKPHQGAHKSVFGGSTARLPTGPKPASQSISAMDDEVISSHKLPSGIRQLDLLTYNDCDMVPDFDRQTGSRPNSDTLSCSLTSSAMMMEYETAFETPVRPIKKNTHNNTEVPSSNSNEPKITLVVDTCSIGCISSLLEIRKLKLRKVTSDGHIEVKGKRVDYGTPRILVPWQVLQELDVLKDNKQKYFSSAKQSKAQSVVRRINSAIRQRTADLRLQSPLDDAEEVSGFSIQTPDDHMIKCCLSVKLKRGQQYPVILITEDINLINKCLACQLLALNFSDFVKHSDQSLSVKQQTIASLRLHKPISSYINMPSRQYEKVPALLAPYEEESFAPNQTHSSSTHHSYTSSHHLNDYKQISAGPTRHSGPQQASVHTSTVSSYNLLSARLSRSPTDGDRKLLQYKIRCSRQILGKVSNHVEALPTGAVLPTPASEPVPKHVKALPQNAVLPSSVSNKINKTQTGNHGDTAKVRQPIETKEMNAKMARQLEGAVRAATALLSSADLSDGQVTVQVLRKSLESLLHPFLHIVVAKEMTVLFDDLWTTIVCRKPPWDSLQTILDVMNKHWIAVFGLLLTRHHDAHVKCLQETPTAADLDAAKLSKMIVSAVALVRALQQTDRDYKSLATKVLTSLSLITKRCKQLTASGDISSTRETTIPADVPALPLAEQTPPANDCHAEVSACLTTLFSNLAVACMDAVSDVAKKQAIDVVWSLGQAYHSALTLPCSEDNVEQFLQELRQLGQLMDIKVDMDVSSLAEFISNNRELMVDGLTQLEQLALTLGIQQPTAALAE